ncbi:MFS transporter [Aspergillus affinis]|uniref:MFS transporter n=1 Tax=Aspergillus affinis TaxID=1070780 RepID=UPI0022FE8059|nr:uncharacterized protein KD926_001553 [Aspergillus affinis]KAI9044322.1 hypothetical protein KD926_001553 [Aspergillus affinis]
MGKHAANLAGLPTANEAILVTWDSIDDTENPRNWDSARKWRVTISISAFVLMNTLSSTIIAPALSQIAETLHVNNDVEKTLILSIFVLGFAIGPFIACPLSEIHGRKVTIHSWNFLYLIFNTVCGVVNSTAAMLVLRFLAGFFCSASQGIGTGVVSDLFSKEQRGRAVAIYSIFPLMGPIVGPVLGGVIAQHTTWRWAFYAASLLDVLILVPSVFTLRETYEPVLLRRKKERLTKETGRTYQTQHDDLDQPRSLVYSNALVRPLKMLATQPIIQMLALYNAILYGVIYILYTNFPTLWTDIYHESQSIAALNYLSLFVGSVIAAEVSTRVIDHIQRHLYATHGGVHLPEFRLPVMPAATLTQAAGIFLYGWSADFRTHWILPNVGAAVFMGAAMTCAIAVNMYMIDTYGKYAASALAAISMLRQIFGCFFPIFSPYLYDRLGYGWGNSVLGFISLSIGLPSVLVLWKWGGELRKHSPYANDGTT